MYNDNKLSDDSTRPATSGKGSDGLECLTSKVRSFYCFFDWISIWSYRKMRNPGNHRKHEKPLVPQGISRITESFFVLLGKRTVGLRLRDLHRQQKEDNQK